jgi:hypothetical protein
MARMQAEKLSEAIGAKFAAPAESLLSGTTLMYRFGRLMSVFMVFRYQSILGKRYANPCHNRAARILVAA